MEVLERVSSEASIRTYLTILIAREARTSPWMVLDGNRQRKSPGRNRG